MKATIDLQGYSEQLEYQQNNSHGQLNIQTAHLKDFINSHDIGGFTNVQNLLKFVKGGTLDDFLLLRGIRSKGELKDMGIGDKINTVIIEKCSRSLTKGQESECIDTSLKMNENTLLASYDHYLDVERYKGFDIIRQVEHKNKNDLCNLSIMRLFIEKAGLQENVQPLDGNYYDFYKNNLISKLCAAHFEPDLCIATAQGEDNCSLINRYIEEYKLDKNIFTPSFLSKVNNDYLYLDALKYFGSIQYQPFFNGQAIIENINANNNIEFSDRIVKGIRESDTKSEALLQQIKYTFGVGKIAKILDVGSNFGYISLYLSANSQPHYHVHGVDSDARNANLSTITAKYLNIPATYETNIVDQKYIHNITKGQYNVVLLTSIMHHIGKQIGLEGSQEFLKNLHAKVPVMFVELASKDEAGLALASHIPDVLTDYFLLLDSPKITSLGSFDSMFLSKDGGDHAPREMYMIEKGIIDINGVQHEIEKNIYNHPCRTEDYVYSYNAKFAGTVLYSSDKMGYLTDRSFIKQQSFTSENFFKKALEDLDVLKENLSSDGKLQSINSHPRLIDWEVDRDSMTVYQVFDRIDQQSINCNYSKAGNEYYCARALVLKDYYDSFGVVHMDISLNNFLNSKQDTMYAVDWDDVVFNYGDHSEQYTGHKSDLVSYHGKSIAIEGYSDLIENDILLYCPQDHSYSSSDL
jgi:hypothetical protein